MRAGSFWTAVALLATGCQSAGDGGSPRVAVSCGDGTLRAEFDEPVELLNVGVLDAAGSSLQDLPCAGRRRAFEVPFDWRPGASYRLRLRLADETLDRSLVAPDAVPALRGSIEAPLGQNVFAMAPPQARAAAESARSDPPAPEEEAIEVLLPEDGAVTLALVVECLRQSSTRYVWELTPSPGVALAEEAAADAAIAQLDRGRQTSGELALRHDYSQRVVPLRIAADAAAPQLRCLLRQWPDAAAAPLEQSLTIRFRSAAGVDRAGLVEVTDVVFPAGADGRRREEQLADAVALPHPLWSRVRRAVRAADALENNYDAYGTQAVWLTNRSRLPLSLLIETEVAHPGGGEPLLAFAPPEWLAPRSSAVSEHVLRLAPGETAAARVPLFARPEVVPGRYERRIRVYLVGDRRPLATAVRPLVVSRGDALVSGVALAACAAALAGIAVAMLLGRRAVRTIGVEGLATIALFAALHFACSYASRIGGNILAGLLGPFATFVAGLGGEGATSLLLAAAVVTIPRTGTFALSTVTVFLLNALFAGQFGLVDVLFVAVSAALGELCLALCGVTTTPWLRRPARRIPLPAVAAVAVSLGVANAATLYSQFCLIQVLHRLFFAAWYVTAVALITGLAYGGIGAGLGAVVGFRLRRTRR